MGRHGSDLDRQPLVGEHHPPVTPRLAAAHLEHVEGLAAALTASSPGEGLRVRDDEDLVTQRGLAAHPAAPLQPRQPDWQREVDSDRHGRLDERVRHPGQAGQDVGHGTVGQADRTAAYAAAGQLTGEVVAIHHIALSLLSHLHGVRSVDSLRC